MRRTRSFSGGGKSTDPPWGSWKMAANCPRRLPPSLSPWGRLMEGWWEQKSDDLGVFPGCVAKGSRSTYVWKGKSFEYVTNRHLTHFNTTHLPKESVNFKAKGAFMTAVSYKIMLYLYPPTSLPRDRLRVRQLQMRSTEFHQFHVSLSLDSLDAGISYW